MSRRTFAIAAACAGGFLAFLDTTIVNTAFPGIAASFPDATPSRLSWVLDAYFIVVAALLVPAGGIADRGTAMYWFLFVLFRVVLRRDTGSLAIADVLLLVIIADAAQNAMSGSYQSVTDGFILVGTIAGWNLLVDWLSFRFERFRKVFEPQPLQLVRDAASCMPTCAASW